ncbi:MAG: sugar kinase [Proteobacteria bacterium]|jgi:2-dehydro-3-deoxygluconokinase|nr:sugar kinase [Pseudomonadota bacterium]
MTQAFSFDVVALGEAMVEFNQIRAGEPTYLQGFGGDTSNAVIAAARAGARTAYLSRVGDDWSGQRLMDLWRAEGVDTRAVEVTPDAATGLYFVTHGPQGHEFGYQRRGSAAARMTPAWFSGTPQAVVAQSRILHVSGISMAISQNACDTVLAAMQAARGSGAQVSFDTNLRLKLWTLEAARAAIAQAAALCDWFLPSMDDAVHLSGHTAPADVIAWAHGLGAPTVVLKLGGDGCLVSQHGQQHHIPGHRVPLVDATGAGDCFCGNLLARLAAGDALVDAARYANAAAALAVQGFGAVAPLPRPAQVHAVS